MQILTLQYMKRAPTNALYLLAYALLTSTTSCNLLEYVTKEVVMTAYQGTRDAPIIIDDDDDNIALVAGPSRPKLSQTSVKARNKSIPKAHEATSDPLRGGGSGRSSKSVNVVHYRGVASMPPNQPQRETATLSHSNSNDMDNMHTLKRKRGIEDNSIKVHRPQPPPPGQTGSASGPSGDPFAGLTKKQRKKLRKRLQVEEESKKKMIVHNSFIPAPPPHPIVQPADVSNNTALPPRNAGPERATYSGPFWPVHIAKDSENPIPGPGQGPLTSSEESTVVPPPQRISDALNVQFTSSQQSQPHPLPPIPASSTSVLSMPPNIFDIRRGIIGKIAPLGSESGLFPVPQDQYVPHDPDRTIVLENMPKRFRTLDFVLQWCRDTALVTDPAPLHIDVMRKLGKALVEFTTHERALRAFNSPKLVNKDGREQINAYWFCPEFAVSTPLPVLHSTTQVSHPLPPRPSQKVCTASITPSNPRSTSRTTHIQPARPSFSMTEHILPKTSSLPSLPDPCAQMILPSMQYNKKASSYPGDSEIEDGEIEEERVPNGAVDDVDSLRITPRNSPYRDDFIRIEKQSRTQQWTDELVLEAQPATSSGAKATDNITVPSIAAPPSPQASNEDTTMGDESPQLMYPDLEDSISEPYSQPIPSHIAKDDDVTVSRNESMDVDMERETSKTLPTNIPGSPVQPSLSILREPSLIPIITEVTTDVSQHQVSGPDQHGLVTTTISEVHNEVENENVASINAATELPPQNISEKLSELRMRVLASRKRKAPPLEPNASTASPTVPMRDTGKEDQRSQMMRKRLLLERKRQMELASYSQARSERSPPSFVTSPEDPNHLRPSEAHDGVEISPGAEPPDYSGQDFNKPFDGVQESTALSFAESSNTSIATTSSDSAASLFSITSSSTTSSISSTKDNGLSKSTSFLDNMATAFLHDILGPAKPDSPPGSAIMPVNPSLNELAMDPKASLQNKQKRYEEHVAKSKSLFALWEAAKEKSEKSRIWALIKEENRSFEAEEAGADAKLKNNEVANTMPTGPTLAPKKRSFTHWPQTRRDALIFSVSDSEDDESDLEGHE